MRGILLIGEEAGLVVDCPGAMPFVRGIVGGVVYRDAAGVRDAASSWAREREVRSPKQISSWRAPRAPPHLPEAVRPAQEER